VTPCARCARMTARALMVGAAAKLMHKKMSMEANTEQSKKLCKTILSNPSWKAAFAKRCSLFFLTTMEKQIQPTALPEVSCWNATVFPLVPPARATLRWTNSLHARASQRDPSVIRLACKSARFAGPEW